MRPQATFLACATAQLTGGFPAARELLEGRGPEDHLHWVRSRVGRPKTLNPKP